jgi:hypothetical protein
MLSSQAQAGQAGESVHPGNMSWPACLLLQRPELYCHEHSVLLLLLTQLHVPWG